MDTAATVTEAINLLEADGYRSDFSFTDGTIRCALPICENWPVDRASWVNWNFSSASAKPCASNWRIHPRRSSFGVFAAV